MLSEGEVAWDIYSVLEAEPSSGRTKIPHELAFETIIQNSTLSPCSLGDLMDFLVCEEQNAEMLQFFIWFCSYVGRWSALSPQEKVLSPPWRPAGRDGQGVAAVSIQYHRRAGSDMLDRILQILDERNAMDTSHRISDQSRERVNSDPMDFSKPRKPPGPPTAQLQVARSQSGKRLTAVDDGDEQLRAKQPYRTEITRVARQYMTPNAPRRLGISKEDLAECLDSVKRTTHPSALLPAFSAAESYLKFRSHPHFVRESQRNANMPRLVLIRAVSIVVVLLGFVLTVLLILSGLPNFYRVASMVLWWPGITMLVAGTKGICLFLYVQNLRQPRPWEQLHQADGKDQDEEKNKGFEVDLESSDEKKRERPSPGSVSLKPAHNGAMLKPSMRVFGGANGLERKVRMEAYWAKPMRHKIWDDAVKTQNRTIRLLQDRTVLMAVWLGGGVSGALTVASLWIPAVDALF